jgi:hypothetical protein
VAKTGLGGRRRERRWIAGTLAVLVVAAASYIVPRLGARSPVAILIVCAMAILVMKLVERRIHRWFQRWEEQNRRGVEDLRNRDNKSRTKDRSSS